LKLKKAQIAIQYIISFVILMILIILSFLFVNNSFQKIYSLIDEKITESNFLYIRTLVMGFPGDPPYWNETLLVQNKTKLVGYSVKPFVLDFEKIFINREIVKNSSLYFKFLEQFTYDLGQFGKGKMEEVRKWVAYYKIKDLDPLVFSEPYGFLRIYRNATNLIIFYNFSNVSTLNPKYSYKEGYYKPYFLIEFLSNKDLNIDKVEGGINYTETKETFYNIKIYNNKSKKTGKIVLSYECTKEGGILKCNYPDDIIIPRLECDPIELCENSGFYEAGFKFPLIGWFGLIPYKKLALESETKELIYNSFIKLPLNYYLAEVHIFVW
jgi:hypothetical protein